MYHAGGVHCGGGDPHGHGFLDGLVRQGDIFHLVIPALKGHVLLRPEPAHERHVLLHVEHAPSERHAQGLEFMHAFLGLRRADADAQYHAAARYDVERRHLIGEEYGVSEAGQKDGGAELHALGSHRHGGEHAQRLEPRLGEHRIAHEHGIVAEFLRAHGQVDDGADFRDTCVPEQHPARGEKHAEFYFSIGHFET